MPVDRIQRCMPYCYDRVPNEMIAQNNNQLRNQICNQIMNEKLMACNRLSANLFGKDVSQNVGPKLHDLQAHKLREQTRLLDDRIYEPSPEIHPARELNPLQHLPLPIHTAHQHHRRQHNVMMTPPRRTLLDDIMGSPESRHLLGGKLMHQLESPSHESMRSPSPMDCTVQLSDSAIGLSRDFGTGPDSRASDVSSYLRNSIFLRDSRFLSRYNLVSEPLAS
jgi:hypothetical protein